MATSVESVREKALADYRKKLIEHKEIESRLKDSKYEKILFIRSTSHFVSPNL